MKIKILTLVLVLLYSIASAGVTSKHKGVIAVKNTSSSSYTVSHVGSTSTANTTSNVTSCYVTPHASVSEGDMMIGTVYHPSSTGTSTTPTGWTQLQEVTSDSKFRGTVYWKLASSDESGSDNFANSNAYNDRSCSISVFSKSGGTWATPTSTENDAQTQGTWGTNSSLTGLAGGAIVGVWPNDRGTNTISTAPTDMSQVYFQSATNTNYGSAAVYYLTGSTATAYTTSLKWGTYSYHACMQVAIGAE